MARRRSYGRSKSRSRGRRSGGGRRRGAGGRYASGGVTRSGSISPMTLAMIAGAGLVGFYLLKSKNAVHPAVAQAMQQQTASTADQIAAAFSAAGGNTDFNSMTNIGLPIPYNPAPGMQNQLPGG